RNVVQPLDIYSFFREIGAGCISFLPLVTPDPDRREKISESSVPARAFGEFLCDVFDEWKSRDIGRIKIQIVEEALRTAFGQEHSLCIFRETCGDIPVIEHNGDFYSCDHYVDKKHRIGNLIETSLVEMMESPQQRAFGRAKRDSLPAHCRRCEVLDMCNGECPKNRFIRTPDGERGLNFLCEGYLRFFAHCRPFVQDVAAVWKLRDESNLKNPVKSIQK
ncbi:MAG: SPASM domain-containing protein, partial [Acidobacteria bacterium]|nr:SPASM domain-containing protein [Acidobacteriota bacterium]MBU1474536.1 SPASM domain-containing protein [Acidobacteriota bacterium]MBU2437621.1 SPASM domain-containing protein [Acidobacteriota bacterium]